MAHSYEDAIQDMLDETRKVDLQQFIQKIIFAAGASSQQIPTAEQRMKIVVDAVRPFAERLQEQYGVSLY